MMAAVRGFHQRADVRTVRCSVQKGKRKRNTGKIRKKEKDTVMVGERERESTKLRVPTTRNCHEAGLSRGAH